MATTIEDRVTVLEREVAGLKARATAEHSKTEAIDADLAGIPALIKAEARLTESRLARVRAEMSDFRAHVDERFNAVIRAIAEVVAERPRRG